MGEMGSVTNQGGNGLCHVGKKSYDKWKKWGVIDVKRGVWQTGTMGV